MKTPLPYLFVIAFAFAVLVQAVVWKDVDFTDSTMFWYDRVRYMQEDLANGPLILTSSRHPRHPGAPTLMLSAAFYSFGFTAKNSLILSAILLNSFLIAFIATVAFRLFRKQHVWLAVSSLALFRSFYISVNPIDTTVSLAILLIFLLGMWHLHKKNQQNISISLMIGVCVGLALATRIHISILMIAPLLTFLLFPLGIKRLFFIAATGLATGWALIPFAWHAPVSFFRRTFFSTTAYLQESTAYIAEIYQVSWFDYVAFAPLSVTSFFLSLLLLLGPFPISPILRRSAISLIACTAITLWLMLSSNLQALRYVLPVYYLWGGMLPVFVFHLLHALPSVSKEQPFLAPATLPRVQRTIILTLALSQIAFTAFQFIPYEAKPLLTLLP